MGIPYCCFDVRSCLLVASPVGVAKSPDSLMETGCTVVLPKISAVNENARAAGKVMPTPMQAHTQKRACIGRMGNYPSG